MVAILEFYLVLIVLFRRYEEHFKHESNAVFAYRLSVVHGVPCGFRVDSGV
jgi:hypothetical protein